MEIKKTITDSAMTVKVIGSLDTTTSPELQAAVTPELENVTKIDFDFADLDYISSAGFRVLLVINKTMSSKGGMLAIHGVHPAVREVFDMTGFSDIFTLD